MRPSAAPGTHPLSRAMGAHAKNASAAHTPRRTWRVAFSPLSDATICCSCNDFSIYMHIPNIASTSATFSSPTTVNCTHAKCPPSALFATGISNSSLMSRTSTPGTIWRIAMRTLAICNRVPGAPSKAPLTGHITNAFDTSSTSSSPASRRAAFVAGDSARLFVDCSTPTAVTCR